MYTKLSNYTPYKRQYKKETPSVRWSLLFISLY